MARTDTTIARAIGSVLRAVRISSGLTLKQVELRSAGRFAATSIAGYERAERGISLQRFCELCDVYQVDAGRLLSGILRSATGTSPVRVDVGRVRHLPERVGPILAAHLTHVAEARGTPGQDVVTVRMGDLEVIATATGIAIDDLVRRIVHGDEVAHASTSRRTDQDPSRSP